MKYFTYAENGGAVLTGLNTNAWTRDIDLTDNASYVGNAPTFPDGATGVIVYIYNGKNAARNCAVQAVDCADDLTQYISPYSRQVFYVKIDVSGAEKTIDVFLQDPSTAVVHIIGYFEGEANFFAYGSGYTNWTNSSAGWEEENLTGLSADAAFAVLLVYGSTSYFTNARHPDSTEDRNDAYSCGFGCVLAPVKVSGSDRWVEVYVENTSVVHYLLGEITTASEVKTTSVQISDPGSIGSYADIDFSGDTPPANAEFAVIEVWSPSTAYMFGGPRHNGDTSYPDIYGDLYRHANWLICPLDGSDICEVKFENANIDIYCWGYLEQAAAGGETVQIGAASMSHTGQALNVNAETKLAIAQTAMLFTGQALTVKEEVKVQISQTAMLHVAQTLKINEILKIDYSTMSLLAQALNVNEKATLPITQTSMTHIGQDLAVNASTIVQIAQAAMTHVGQALNVIANEIVQIAQTSITHVGQTLVVNAKTTVAIVKATMTYLAQAVNVNATTVLQIAQTAMTYVGQSVTTGGAQIIQIAQTAMAYVAQAVNVNAKTTIQIVQAAMTQAGQSLVVNAKQIITIGQTSMAYAARTLKINEIIKISQAVMTYLGRSFTIPGVGLDIGAWMVRKIKRRRRR